MLVSQALHILRLVTEEDEAGEGTNDDVQDEEGDTARNSGVT